MPALQDITVTPNKDTTASTQAVKSTNVLQLAAAFMDSGNKAAEWMEQNCTADFVIAFGDMQIPRDAMIGSTRACCSACPDFSYNASEPTLLPSGEVEVHVRVTGTHTGDAFAPMPGMQAIPASGVRCENDPEKIIMSFTSGGKLSKCLVTIPKVTRGFSGPPGWYTQMKASASSVNVLSSSPFISVTLDGDGALPSTSDSNFHRPITNESGSGGIYMWSSKQAMEDANKANSSRQFSIMRNVTRHSFDAIPGRSFDDAKAALIINGSIAEGLDEEALCHKFDGEMAAEAGKTYGSIPGVITKIFLRGCSSNVQGVIGGCYLFESMQDIENYLAGEVWGAVKDDTSMWTDVKIQKFTVNSGDNIDASVHAFMHAFAQTETQLGGDWTPEKQRDYETGFYEEDAMFIRPSGNPLSLKELGNMFASGKITGFSTEIVSVDSVKALAGGSVAVVTCTNRQKFCFGDVPNDDLAKYSYVLSKNSDGGWRISHGHRATGQKPAE